MQTKKDGIYWIEAENFARTDRISGPENPARTGMIQETSAASGGKLVVSFQRPDAYLEYEIKEETDGRWEYGVWIRYASTCPSSRVALSLNGKDAGSIIFPETGDFFHTYRWEKIGTVIFSKGNHLLRLTLKTGIIHPDLLILTPDDGPIISGAIEESIRTNSYAVVTGNSEKTSRDRLWFQHDRNGVPLGGLGTGKIELAQDGGFVNISINNNQDAPIATVPGAFFLYRERASGDKGWTVRMLEKTGRTVQEIENISYDGMYPFVRVSYDDAGLTANLSLEAFSPMTPYHPDDSSVPAAVFRFTVKNPSKTGWEVSLGFSWENLAGCGGLPKKPEFGPGTALRVDGQVFWTWNDRTGNDQKEWESAEAKGLLFTGSEDHGYPSSFGGYLLLGRKQPGVKIGVTRSYNVETDIPALGERCRQGIPETLLKTAGKEGAAHPAGIVWADMLLKPGENKTMEFILAWHFPYCVDSLGRDCGVFYSNRFSSVEETGLFMIEESGRLREAALQVPERIMKSSLPAWLSSMIVNEQFPLTSCTWFDKQGRFSVNEAPSMMHGCLGTIDQRTCSQGVYTSLFPSLDRTELKLFADFQRDNGMISHDLGFGYIDSGLVTENCWPDLVSSFIIEVHRYVQATGDIGFAREAYRRIPKAVEWALSLDDDKDGVPDMKTGRGNTYDNSDWQGCSAFIASLWIAGLHAASDLARFAGRESDGPRYSALAKKVAETMERKLWNGSFYRNFACNDPGRKDGEHSILPQVAGEWALDLADLPRGLPEDRVLSALKNVYRRNIAVDKFKSPADEVLPSGEPAFVGAAFIQYSWLYFGALAAYRDLGDEALQSWRQAYESTWEINRQPWKTRLTAYALTGKFNGLPWYMTNTATWYIIHAVSGFAYSTPDQWLRVDPHMPGSWRDSGGSAVLSVPLFGSGFWLWLDYREDPGRRFFSVRTDRLFLNKPPLLKQFRTTLRAGAIIKSVAVNGQPVSKYSFKQDSGRLIFDIGHEFKEGSLLKIEII